ncbi:MAG: hypothetical protein C4527_14245 [Candidatus Omnitrophota bacterium]|jgi:hypothetical protein|nr:MAG: hypothetical protein C4527_14245 [Candidatus Omnitrophota bacterium]
MKTFLPHFSIVLFLILYLLPLHSSVDEFRTIRVSLIAATQSDTFAIDKKIQSLESILKKAAKKYQKFVPLAIVEKQTIKLDEISRIPLTKTMFVEITLESLVKDYYPITVRWFTKTETEEKEIVKAEQHKLRVNFSLLIGKSASEKSVNAELIAIEFVDPSSP